MKEHRSLRNLIIAMAFFVLWGNVVSFMLPPDAHDAIVKLVDFASILFALAVLIAGLSGLVRARKGSAQGEKKAEGSDRDGPA